MRKPDETRKEVLSRVYSLILALPLNEEASPSADDDKDRLLTEVVGEPRSIPIVPKKGSEEGVK